MNEEKKPELWIVNTKIYPSFLGVEVEDSDMIKTEYFHADFIDKVKEHYAGFDIPYLAFFKKGMFLIPERVVSTDAIHGGVLAVLPLDEFLEKHIIGKDTIYIGRTIPLTAIVEFSDRELFPGVMKRMAEKYDIKRVMLDDGYVME